MIENPIWHLMWREARKAFRPVPLIIIAAGIFAGCYQSVLNYTAAGLMFFLVGRAAWSLVPRLERDGAAQEVMQLSPLENRDFVSALRRIFFAALSSWLACSLISTLLYAFLRPEMLPTHVSFTVYFGFILCIYYWLAVMPELGCVTRSVAILVSALFLALIHAVGSRFAMQAIQNGVWWSAMLIVVVFSLPGIGLAITSYFWATADIRLRIAEALRHRVEREPLF